MSLNKFTDINNRKEWMNINCNEIRCATLSADTLNATKGTAAIMSEGNNTNFNWLNTTPRLYTYEIDLDRSINTNPARIVAITIFIVIATPYAPANALEL